MCGMCYNYIVCMSGGDHCVGDWFGTSGMFHFHFRNLVYVDVVFTAKSCIYKQIILKTVHCWYTCTGTC